MRLPGFAAEESLYRPRRNYRGMAGVRFASGDGAVRAEWDFCYECRPSGLKFCCDGSFPNLRCADVPCCTPSCSPCSLSTYFWPPGFPVGRHPTGSFACIDGRCNTSVHPCQFCRGGTPSCSTDCKTQRCSPDDQACQERCDCCCDNFLSGEDICRECLHGDPDTGQCLRT
jgi:hypothetical protein